MKTNRSLLKNIIPVALAWTGMIVIYGATAVAQEGERQSAGRIGPAIGRADAAVSERAWVADGAEPRMPGLAARERAETAMHGIAGVRVDEIPGEVAGHIVDHPRRHDALAAVPDQHGA